MGLIAWMLPDCRLRQWIGRRYGIRHGEWWIIANNTAIRVTHTGPARSGKPKVNVRDIISRL